MPLSRGCSKKSRSKNVATLIREGKPPAQAAAISYSVQRQEGCDVPRRAYKARSRGHISLSDADLKVLVRAAESKHEMVWLAIEARGFHDMGGGRGPFRSAEKLAREGLLARDEQTPLTSLERGGRKQLIVVTYRLTPRGRAAYDYYRQHLRSST